MERKFDIKYRNILIGTVPFSCAAVPLYLEPDGDGFRKA
jgi:hypothetical protein